MNNNFSLFGNDLFGKEIKQKKNGVLAQKFEFPPFSVLSARDGLWQERKRMWLGTGIKSELGREKHPQPMEAKDLGHNLNNYRDKAKSYNSHNLSWRPRPESFDDTQGTSVFDPVLCELVYKWFCPEHGQIVDPFAGGSVRGIVAGLMGYKYHGIDLSERQIEANDIQHQEICPTANIKWVVGDSMEEMDNAPDADFIFSCPPYGDLERYSDDERDLSTMEYHTFIAAYKRIILRCYKKLKTNGFACFVVGDFRDTSTGMYRGFVADTINAFREVGMPLYNDAILITSVGSLPIRVSSQFEKSRKLGKTHQNILVFCKGNPKKVFEDDFLA